VAINGEPIEPTDYVYAAPGDIITCEIHGEWAGGARIKTWQFQIDGRAFGLDSGVMPAYWDNLTDVWCTSDADCFGEQICWWHEGPYAYCAGPDHHPEDGAFIDSGVIEYVYAPPPGGQPPTEFKAIDLLTLSFRYASTLLLPGLAPAYAPPPKYFGTFTLEILPGGFGAFPVNFVGGSASFFVNLDGQIIYPTLEGLTIQHGGEQCLFFSDPPDGAIDARQPSAPDGSLVAGWDAITFMVGFCDPCWLRPADFEVREVPPDPDPPSVTDVTRSYDKATVRLSRSIREGKWTCISLVWGWEEFCISHLPGDVNGDGTSAPSDILHLIDCLNNVARCEPWQCDVDRSGLCRPPDVLRVIDLLNGAGVYEPYLNRSLPPYPRLR
jgi:hypothetical protein